MNKIQNSKSVSIAVAAIAKQRITPIRLRRISIQFGKMGGCSRLAQELLKFYY